MVAVSEHKQKSKLQHEDGERMGVADAPLAFLPPRSASFSTTACNLEQFCSFVQYSSNEDMDNRICCQRRQPWRPILVTSAHPWMLQLPLGCLCF
ncbi:unnamed protein product [Urochloa humidicola]